MRMKSIRTILCVAVMTAAFAAGTAMAQESETGSVPEESTEQMPESETAAPASRPVPETRPDYTALDYVLITDEGYKGLDILVYPPADGTAEAQTAYKTSVDTAIMEQLFAKYPITQYPQDLLDYVTGSLIGTYQQYAEMYGMDFASFLQTYLQMAESTFRQQVQTAAEQTLKEELLLKAVAEKENITVSDEEYEQGCVNYAAKYGYEAPEALKQAFDEPTIRISLLMDKTFEYLETVTNIELIIETETETEGGVETESELPAEGLTEKAAEAKQ